MYVSDQWNEYEVLDTGDGAKLERWGRVILDRPDPQVIWPKADPALWEKADGRYIRSSGGGGQWSFGTKLPERWVLHYRDLKFYVHPTGFKHTGIFPEQAANWDAMRGMIGHAHREVRVLNLFAYTGCASIACAAAEAHVTHVDAARGMIAWAKDNRALNALPEDRFRFIAEDALSFVRREKRRGSLYQGLVMDPPSYGRGPGGEVWKLENELYGLISECASPMAPDALFFFVNSYTTGLQPAVLRNLLEKTVGRTPGAQIDAQETVLPVSTGGLLPCGACGRCVFPAGRERDREK